MVARVIIKLCTAPPSWLVAAAGSLATCGIAFFASPHIVLKLLPRHATLTYKDAKDEESSGCRYVAFVHAVTASALNTYILMATTTFDDSPRNPDPTPLMWRKSQLSHVSLGISLGYFLVDALLVAHYKPAMGGAEMVAHHLAAFASVATTIAFGEAHMYTLVLLATEWTTPFINFRWLLDKMDWKETRLYKANGLALLSSWMVVRIGLFGWFFKHLYDRREQLWRAQRPVQALLLTVPPLLTALNLMWFEKIVRGVIKAFFQTGGPKKNDSEPRPATPEDKPRLPNGYNLKSE